MADVVTVDMDVMIIEAGIMAGAVTSSEAGKVLQNKIQAAADEAWAQQKPDVVLSFSPFEAGLMLGGLSRSGGNVTGDLINRTFAAVNAKMVELNIQPLNNPTPSLGGGDLGPAAGLDPEEAAAQAQQSAPQAPADDESKSSDDAEAGAEKPQEEAEASQESGN